MTADSIAPIGSRSDFQDTIRSAFARVREEGAREILLVDPDFVTWPLNDRAVVASLVDWAESGRSLTVLAHNEAAISVQVAMRRRDVPRS